MNDPKEWVELAAAWVVLSLAFGILYSGVDLGAFTIAFPICLITVGLGFALHELGHKYLAQHYGLNAVFKANYSGLGLALLFSLAGFVIVTPGAVRITGSLTREQDGKISLLGPLMNLLLGLGFLSLYLNPLINVPILELTFWIGYRINVWIGLFNLIPTHPFDGSKIKEWNTPVYVLMAILTGGLYLLSYVL